MKDLAKLVDMLWIFTIFWMCSVSWATTVRGLPTVGADRRSAVPRWRWRFALP